MTQSQMSSEREQSSIFFTNQIARVPQSDEILSSDLWTQKVPLSISTLFAYMGSDRSFFDSKTSKIRQIDDRKK